MSSTKTVTSVVGDQMRRTRFVDVDDGAIDAYETGASIRLRCVEETMIWSSTNAGEITYASPEWATFTGQSIGNAIGGWLGMVHPEDRDATLRFFKEACAAAALFTVRYRLRRRDGAYSWVMVGAAPSISPIDGSFLGYIGAINEDDAVGWNGVMGTSMIRPPSPAMAPHTPVDMVADHLLIARSVAATSGEDRLLASIDFALSEVMRRLGYPGHRGASH